MIAASLRVLAEITPDVVISSAFDGEAVHRIDPAHWRGHIAHAIAGLPSPARR